MYLHIYIYIYIYICICIYKKGGKCLDTIPPRNCFTFLPFPQQPLQYFMFATTRY